MPNNGIISRYATVPEEFKVNTTTEFDNTTDTIVVNKALNGIKVEQKAVTLNQLAGMVGGGGSLNYQSVLVFLQFQSDAFFTTPIVNEWGTFTTSTILGSGNANCQFVFDTPFTNKIAVVQFSSADTNINSRKWYSYETVDGSTIDINVGMGTTSSTQAVTAGNLTGMKAVVEFRFYNS